MLIILLFTVIGFLAGLVYVMKKRKLKAGSILTVTLLGLLSAGIWKVLKDYSSKVRGRKRYF